MYHTPCKDIRMNSEALHSFNERVPCQTQSEIFQKLQMTGLLEIDPILQHQVNYQ